MMTAMKLLIAGGGTGGHLFPGMAVAEEWQALGKDFRAVFVGTAQGIESRLVPEAGYEFAVIRSKGIAGKGAFSKIKGLMLVPFSILDAVSVVRKYKPDVALGVGGYVSGPSILAAWLLGTPCAIQEQNAHPGATNRLLERIVKKVFVSFDAAKTAFANSDKKGKLVVSGNPARGNIVRAILSGKKVENEDGKLGLLIVGGSQGAHRLNEIMVEAAEISRDYFLQNVKTRHQTGKNDLGMVEEKYKELGLDAIVEPFINDMAAAYTKADLIVSRSGAGAVSEIALAGLPSILVPFPFAAGDHQTMNAKVLMDEGAAIMHKEKDLSAEVLAGAIKEILGDEKKRDEMAKAAKKCARPDAAGTIVKHLIELAKDKK